MEHFMGLLKENLNIDLIQIIISNQRKKSTCQKISIRPVLIREQLLFQCTKTVGQKVLHSNYEASDVVSMIEQWLLEDFKQIEVITTKETITALVNKKGGATVKRKPQIRKREQTLSHNRTKRYLLPENQPVDFLVDLGIMTDEGKVVRSKYDKFKQINRFLEFIEDILPNLSRDREVTIIDFGCGKSYLTFAMYYYLKEQNHYDVSIIGLDLKKDVIEHCSQLAARYGYEKLRFYQGSIEDYEGVKQVDMVVTLHACDTATDYALYKAVLWNAKVILSVPCCQHELNGQMQNEVLSPILSYGLIKERIAALATDALRAQLLEGEGYRTQILEFIDMEHTPKNLLIRAVKTDQKADNEQSYHSCRNFLHVEPTLESLLKNRS